MESTVRTNVLPGVDVLATNPTVPYRLTLANGKEVTGIWDFWLQVQVE